MENRVNDKIANPNLDKRGKFAPGNCANPHGRPKNAEPELLREALRREGKKRGMNFWQKVAEYAFRDKQVMIAIIKKYVPDLTHLTGDEVLFGGTNIVIVREKESGKGNNSRAVPSELSKE